MVVALLKGFYPLGAGIGYKIHLSCKECSLPFLMSLCSMTLLLFSVMLQETFCRLNREILHRIVTADSNHLTVFLLFSRQ